MANKVPFRYGTRQRVQRVGQQKFVEGSLLTFELPRVGYCSAIYARLSGTITRETGATGGLTDHPFDIIDRLTLDTNAGAGLLHDLSGHGCYLMNSTQKAAYSPDLGGPGISPDFNGDTIQDIDVYTFNGGDSGEPQLFCFTYYLPVSLNDGQNFNLGQMLLQSTQIRGTLKVKCGELDALLANFDSAKDSVDLTVTVYYIFYEVPNPNIVDLPTFDVHRIIETRIPIIASGDTVYELPKQGTLLRTWMQVTLNGAHDSADVNNILLRFNRFDTPYDMDRGFMRFWQRFRYGNRLPDGAFCLDLWNSEATVSQGDFRDSIDTDRVAVSELVVTIDSGATLGSSNNYLDIIREVVQEVNG